MRERGDGLRGERARSGERRGELRGQGGRGEVKEGKGGGDGEVRG